MQSESLSDYDFILPERLIAQRPLKERRASRLLVLTKGADQPLHEEFADFLTYLNPSDALVLNNTRVFPARLFGTKEPTGGKVEILLSRPLAGGNWLCLANTKGGIRPGLEVNIGDATATFFRRIEDEPGGWEVEFSDDVFSLAESKGNIPLPPYITRAPEEADSERYQTVYSDPDQKGAVAAPTAGLHFDEDMLDLVRNKGVEIVHVTLHVGPGTFLPIRTENLDEHQMHVEKWSISQEAAETLNATRARGGRVIAVGTTSVRTLESAFNDGFKESEGLTKLFIRPGFRFRAVDAILTNFHQPNTTLLMLVAAAIGRERLLSTYLEAIEKEYRFFSYGDACYFELEDFAK